MPDIRTFLNILHRTYVQPLRDNPKGWLKQTFPISKWLPLYQAAYIPYDIIAGFTVGITLLPISMAYAELAFLRPEFGLYSSFVGMIVYLFMGTSKDAIIGPSAITSMMVSHFNQYNPLFHEGDNTYATILCLTSGAIMILIGILKLGFIVNLFSIPVVSGFTSAAALSIIATELRTLVGIPEGPDDFSTAEFVKQLKNIIGQYGAARKMDITFGCCSLAFLLVVEYGHIYFELCIARCTKEPKGTIGRLVKHYFLVCLRLLVAARNIAVFFTTTALAYHFYQSDPEGMKNRLTLVGSLKPGLPPLTLPKWTVTNVTKQWMPFDNNTANGTWIEKEIVLQNTQTIMRNLAIGIVVVPLMSIMELFAITNALGRKNGYRIDPSQELVSVGLANIFQSFIQAYPITAATVKTVLNDRCGVKSLLSTLVSIAIVLVSLEYLTNIFNYVSEAALSAIIISATHRLFDYNAPRAIWMEYKPDFVLWIFTFLVCLFYDLAYGIVIAILINMVVFLRPFVNMKLSVNREPLEIISTGLPIGDHHLGRVTIVQLSHDLKYLSVNNFMGQMVKLLASTDVHFVIDCRFVTGFDFTGVQAWRMLLRLVAQTKKHIIFTNVDDIVMTQLKHIGMEHCQYAKDLETAVMQYSSKLLQEHHALTSPNELDEEDEHKPMIPKYRKTFSFIFNDPGINSRKNSVVNFQMLHRVNSNTTSGTSRDFNHRAPLEVTDEDPKVEENRKNSAEAAASNQDAETPEWMTESRKEQEYRILKLLMEQTTPNFYGDLPLAIGLGDFDGLQMSYDRNNTSNQRSGSV